MVALAALAGGCARVIIADLAQPKLDIAAQYQGIIPVNIREKKLVDEVDAADRRLGRRRGVRVLGLAAAWESIVDLAAAGRHHRRRRPAGRAGRLRHRLAVGQGDHASTSVFRYAHQYDRAIALMASGQVDLKPLISETFTFEDSIKAFERAVEARPTDVKLQIWMEGGAVARRGGRGDDMDLGSARTRSPSSPAAASASAWRSPRASPPRAPTSSSPPAARSAPKPRRARIADEVRRQDARASRPTSRPPPGCDAVDRRGSKKFGGADILINNAGTGSNETIAEADRRQVAVLLGPARHGRGPPRRAGSCRR